MENSQKIWYSFQGKYPYKGPYFYNGDDFHWTKEVEQQWEIIQEEMQQFIEQHQQQFNPYFNKSMVSGAKKWKAASFMFWGLRFRKNARQCVKTMQILKKIPGLVSASISMLEPDAEIFPHHGDTNAIIRCHLGLQVPAGLPECGFQVGEEQQPWQEGKLLLFNDGEYHFAWNNSNAQRFILLFDVIRPEFLHKKRKICTTVLTALAWQFITQQLPILRKLPDGVKKAGIKSILWPLVYGVVAIRSGN